MKYLLHITTLEKLKERDIFSVVSSFAREQQLTHLYHADNVDAKWEELTSCNSSVNITLKS